MRRRTNILWGLVALVVAVIVVARVLGYLPDGAADIAARLAPILLVLAGLSLLLRRRLPFADIIALLACALIAGVVVTTAYSTRATQQRDDTRQPIEQALGENLILLRLRIETLSTDVDLLGTLTSGVSGEFVGSSDNHIEVSYTEAADNTATLTLREVRQSGDFPMLETIGRGTLHIEVPPNVPIDVDFIGSDGAAVLNLGATALEHLNVTTSSGDVVITLPAYNPLFTQATDLMGTITVGDGDLAMFIPPNVAARLELDRGGSGIQPQYNPDVYNYLVGDVLEARSITSAPIAVNYMLRVPRGLIRIEVPS